MCGLWKWASSDLPRADEAVGLPSSPLLWKPKPRLTWRWNKGLKAEGSARTQEIQVLSFTAGPQPISVIDTFNKSAWQRCRLRKIHCGSVTALQLRAYKSPRELCFLLEGASQGSAPCGASCTTCGHKEDLLHPWSLAENGIHCCIKGMPGSHGCNRVIYKQHIQQV